MSTGGKQMPRRKDVMMVYPIWVTHGWRINLQRMLPPLGVLSLASYLELNGFDVAVLDLHASKMSPEDFIEKLRTLRPRYVGITVLTPHVFQAHCIAKFCKEVVPDVTVIVGGPHAEISPEEMLDNPYIDAVGRGDGEEIMLELLRGDKFSSIQGLSYRDGTEICHNKVRPLNSNLDKYPAPAYHLIDLKKYLPPIGTYRNLPAISMLMSRGCPGKCTFCNSAMTTLRWSNVEKVVGTIRSLINGYGIKQINFYDDTFTANPKLVKDFCQLVIDEGIKFTWTCFVRGDMFREELARLMAQAGCSQILLGIESGNSELMNDIGKKISCQKYREIIGFAHKYGIEVRGSFIIGHLNETRQTLNETLEFAKMLDLDFFQYSILTPYPGTQLYKFAKENGLLLHEDFVRYGQGQIILKMKYLDSKDLLNFERKALLQFYFRPLTILRQLRRLSSPTHLMDILFALVMILSSSFLKRKESGLLKKWLSLDGSFVSKKGRRSYRPKLTYEVQGKFESKGANLGLQHL